MLYPVLGLLGTVTGMIEVFDVVSFLGTGNARALASELQKSNIADNDWNGNKYCGSSNFYSSK